jgi:hypothetical protein
MKILKGRKSDLGTCKLSTRALFVAPEHCHAILPRGGFFCLILSTKKVNLFKIPLCRCCVDLAHFFMFRVSLSRKALCSPKTIRPLSLALNITCSKALNEYSLKNPEAFWSEAAKAVSWSKPFTKVRHDCTTIAMTGHPIAGV